MAKSTGAIQTREQKVADIKESIKRADAGGHNIVDAVKNYFISLGLNTQLRAQDVVDILQDKEVEKILQKKANYESCLDAQLAKTCFLHQNQDLIMPQLNQFLQKTSLKYLKHQDIVNLLREYPEIYKSRNVHLAGEYFTTQKLIDAIEMADVRAMVSIIHGAKTPNSASGESPSSKSALAASDQASTSEPDKAPTLDSNGSNKILNLGGGTDLEGSSMV